MASASDSPRPSSGVSRRAYFVSYSHFDGKEFANWLVSELGARSVAVEWDRGLEPGRQLDHELTEKIRRSAAFLYLITEDSVSPGCWCPREASKAMKYHVPIIPLKADPSVDPGRLPFSVEGTIEIDFTRDRESAFRQLLERIEWIATHIKEFEEERKRKRARELRVAMSQSPRNEAQIRRLQLELDLIPEKDSPSEQDHRRPEVSQGLVINQPPYWVDLFVDRQLEREKLLRFLQGPQRLLWISGKKGQGKTAIGCWGLKHFPAGKPGVDVVYLRANGTRANWPELFDGLAQCLPKVQAAVLREHASADVRETMRSLLRSLGQNEPLLVLFDNFEDVLDPDTRSILDVDLRVALQALLEAPVHRVKLILTSRLIASDLTPPRPQDVAEIRLNLGLPFEESLQLLSELDPGGNFGLDRLTQDDLREIHEMTAGNPKSLEMLMAILGRDADATLKEVLDDARSRDRLPPEEILEVLVGEAFSRLAPDSRIVMQALAVFGEPVTEGAVRHLLEPYLPASVEVRPLLRRLVNCYLVKKTGDAYSLHPTDRTYALSRLTDSAAFGSIEGDIYQTLCLRAAEYFRSKRACALHECQDRAQLAPWLSESDLLLRGGAVLPAARIAVDMSRTLNEFDRDLGNLLRHCHARASDLDEESAWSVSHALGTVERRLGNLDRSLELLRGCWSAGVAAQGSSNRKLAQSAKQLQVIALNDLGTCHRDRDELSQASRCDQLAFALHRELGDLDGAGTSLGNLAISLAYRGQTGLAIRLYTRALRVDRATGDSSAKRLANIGVSFGNLGAEEIALEWFGESIRLDPRDIHPCYSKSTVLIDQKRHAEAVRELEHLLPKVDSTGFARYQIAVREKLCLAHLLMGSPETAVQVAEGAPDLAVPRQDHAFLVVFGLALIAAGQQQRGVDVLRRAVGRCDRSLAHGAVFSAAADRAIALTALEAHGGEGRARDSLEALRATQAMSRDRGLMSRLRDLLREITRSAPHAAPDEHLALIESIQPDSEQEILILHAAVLQVVAETDRCLRWLTDCVQSHSEESGASPFAIGRLRALLANTLIQHGDARQAIVELDSAASALERCLEGPDADEALSELTRVLLLAADEADRAARGSGIDRRRRCRDLLLADRRKRGTTPSLLRPVLARLLGREGTDARAQVKEFEAAARVHDAVVFANLESERIHPQDSALARALAERARDLAIQHLGENHIEVGHALNNLGVLQTNGDELSGAEQSIQRSIQIRKSCLGERHRDYAEGLITWAVLLERKGHSEQALEVSLRALDIFISQIAIDDPDFRICVANLVNLVSRIGGAERVLNRPLAR